MPIQPALRAGPKSNSPQTAAAAQPQTSPAIAAHCCKPEGANSRTPTRTARVVPARTGAAIAGAPSGISPSFPKMISKDVADTSIKTVPVTVGVIIRRRSESREMTDELNQRGDRQQARQHGGPAFGKRRDADRQERGTRSDGYRIAGAEPPYPKRLENPSQPAHRQTAEEEPSARSPQTARPQAPR